MPRNKKKQKHSVLVIGGGIAGATVAERLGRACVHVHLVEKEADIGGRVSEMGCKATDTCLRCNVCVADEILRSVRRVPSVQIHTLTNVTKLQQGTNGRRFTATLEHPKHGQSSVNVDAVIIAIGYEPYNPVENSSYGYGRVANVITGVEAERQLATQNRITRPSDGLPPRRVAFIQCVGSRTEEIFRRPDDTDYCSTVCCAYALRMAQQLKFQAEESEITVFYMDIQNFGKGFNDFYKDCKDKMTFVRSRPYELAAGADGAVRVKYAPVSQKTDADSAVCDEEFDLVILSVGIRPPADALTLADTLGVPLDEQGFFGLKTASPLPDMQRAGVFVVGACESPKDIAGCIAQAEAVSAMVLAE